MLILYMNTFPLRLAHFINFNVDQSRFGSLHATIVCNNFKNMVMGLFPVQGTCVLNVAIGINNERCFYFITNNFKFANITKFRRTVMVVGLNLHDGINDSPLINSNRIRVLSKHGRVFIDVFHRDMNCGTGRNKTKSQIINNKTFTM